MAKRRFISWNINGIRSIAKKEALKWIDTNTPDLLALQEIKAQIDQIPNNLFKHQYQNLFISTSYKRGQSGVALFTDIKPSFYSRCYEVDILKEGRINEIHFNNIAFFNVYFPNGKRSIERLEYKLQFYDRFLDYIENLKKQGMDIIFCGDINTAHTPIDLARPKENEKTSGFLKKERAWIDKVIDAGYIDTFRYIHGNKPKQYTWWSMRTRARERNVGWRIDYFFVSNSLKEKIIDAGILPDIKGSDHCPIYLDINI